MEFFINKIFGSRIDRELKKLFPIVDSINNLEQGFASFTNEQLKSKTEEFKNRLINGATLEDILEESFALVRETSNRLLNLRHFDVQLIGGIVLHKGKIAEMKTGEGKTLVATLPVYLNALKGKGVHIVTVNDYLAKRDAQWMGPIYDFLGLSVGIIQHENSFLYDTSYRAIDKKFDCLKPCSRREAYYADVTYGTNNEFGFDYLKDNMKYDLSEFSQRELNYAIIDEVDSILVDESRTPLIISGPSEESTNKYYVINKIIPYLKIEEDFKIDEKQKNIVLTEAGSAKSEKLLGVKNLFDPVNIQSVHHIIQGLKAHYLFKKDVDYVLKNSEIIIVDEFTGRLMQGRRWSDGLHQAIEAKEGVKIENESQTLATITFQNLFRMYKKLAGMTGTAKTEEEEFLQIYNLEVIVIPTNKSMIRQDFADMVYKTENAKYNAVVKEIIECNKSERPVLVGTISIEKSELISKLLKSKGIKHSVLNAKYHEKEADIIAQAGRVSAITISTNMAGRGTDIVLGGNPIGLTKELLQSKKKYTDEEFEETIVKTKILCEEERQKVLSLGGLHIIGTERHEARRIDNQLRGRAGRQGDPGSTRFYLSLEDNLMKIFGSDKINSFMNLLKMDEDIPIENKMVTKAIESAQKKVELHNFDIRKHLLKYDDVMNSQRKEIYSFRQMVFKSESLKDKIFEMVDQEIDEILHGYCNEDMPYENWDINGLKNKLYGDFSLKVDIDDFKSVDKLQDIIILDLKSLYEEKEHFIGDKNMRYIEKIIFLQVIDSHWKDHLLLIDHMKEGIGLRGYAQQDPLIEYKKESLSLFEEMSDRITSEVLSSIFKFQSSGEQQNLSTDVLETKRQGLQVKEHIKIGRNDMCLCGSGKKYKKCCEGK